MGVATILPHAASQVRHLETKLLGAIGRWGYDEIILPTFEYLDVLAPGLEAELLETCYQFVDRTTGRTLLLRPDATAQVARTIAMGLTGDRFPQRFFVTNRSMRDGGGRFFKSGRNWSVSTMWPATSKLCQHWSNVSERRVLIPLRLPLVMSALSKGF